MGIKEIFEKIKGMRQEETGEIDDSVTKDKYLRSLRREDRLLDEEEEKEYLKGKIAERKKEKLKKHLFGIKTDIQKKKLIHALNKKKKVKILSDGHSLLKDNRIKKVKQEKQWLRKHGL